MVLCTSTPSFATGPQSGDVSGGNFMYIETSGSGGPYTLTSECFDISSFTTTLIIWLICLYGPSSGVHLMVLLMQILFGHCRRSEMTVVT